MKKQHKKLLLSNLVLMATLAMDQTYAETKAMQISIDNKFKPAVTTNNKKASARSSPGIKSIPNKANTGLTKTKRNLTQQAIKPKTVSPNQPAIGGQSSLRKRLESKNLGKDKINLNGMKELNGFKRLDSIVSTPAPGNIGPSAIIPRTGGHIAGQDYGAIKDNRGGVTTFMNLSGGRDLMFPTPAGGTHYGSQDMAQVYRDGSFYVFVTDGYMTLIPAGDVENDSPPPSTPTPTPGRSQPANEPENESNEPENESNEPEGESNEPEGESNESEQEEGSGSGDDGSSGEESDGGDTGEDGATENRVGGGSYNRAPGATVIDDFMAKKKGEKRDAETGTPPPCGEDDGSGPVAEPGPEGEAPCSFPIGNSEEEEGEAPPPSAEDYVIAQDHRSTSVGQETVVNPSRFEEDRPDNNQSRSTLERVGDVINPGSL